jgi:hypothetical protein
MAGKEGYMDDGEKVQGLINSAGAERHGIWTRTGAFPPPVYHQQTESPAWAYSIACARKCENLGGRW